MDTPPAPVMLTWRRNSLPCPITGKPHRSNRAFMVLSSRAASLRCTDTECRQLVASKARRWPGVRLPQWSPPFLPADHVGAVEFSEAYTRYHEDNGRWVVPFDLENPFFRDLKKRMADAAAREREWRAKNPKP